MTTYQAVFVSNGKTRRIVLEAIDQEEALTLAKQLGCGLEEKETTAVSVPRPPEAFDEATARQMLGNISRTTLYRLLVRGKIQRVPGTRKVLVTRRSLERFCTQPP